MAEVAKTMSTIDSTRTGRKNKDYRMTFELTKYLSYAAYGFSIGCEIERPKETSDQALKRMKNR